MQKTKGKTNKGITLIALVITIIVLIILAGVTLSIVLGENGLLAKAIKGAENYQYAGIKERVESEILALDIEKVAKGEKLTIQDALIGLKEKGTFEEIDIESNSGVCEGYVVELGYNADGKVVIKGIEKDTGTRIVATINPTGYTNQKVEVTISVKGNEKKVTNIEVQDGMTKKAGTSEQDYIYEVEANGTYHVKATLEDGTTIEKDIVIATIDKLPPNDFEITAENTGTGIKISGDTTTDANADDDNVQSGMDRYEYYVKKSTEADSEYQKYETNEIEGLEVGKYNVYVKAYDKAGNSKESNIVEVEVKLKLKFQQVSAGMNFCLGIDIDGNLWAWGSNSNGQLGDNTKEDKIVPTKITIASNSNIKFSQISAGNYFSLSIDTEGNLWAWGSNSYGQLGDNTKENKIVPTKITIESNSNIKFSQISAGHNYSLAIDTEGNLWAWGRNYYGQLGDNTKEDKIVPTKITIESNSNIKFSKIAALETHSLAIDTEGNLWSWGTNSSGQLGDGTTKEKLIPTKIEIQDNTNIKFNQLTESSFNTSFAIDTESNLWAWGLNSSGQLGDGTTEERTSPVQIMKNEQTKFKEISMKSSSNTLALDTEGNLWTWGKNNHGQLGIGTFDSSNRQITPLKIELESKLSFKQISTGDGRCFTIDTYGYLWAWGSNSNGQLGDGTTQDKSIPTPIAQ